MRASSGFLLAVTLVGGLSCDSKPQKTQLRVFMADALLRSFNVLGQAFERANPNVELVQIPSGSVLAAKRITEANDFADVLAVADYRVIDNLMRPAYADWSICFATNEIGIVYTDASSGAAQLTADNWFDILSRAGVQVGASNPLHDPCGYWTELCWRLADLHYPAAAGGGSITQRMTAKLGQPDSRRSDAEQLLQLVESRGGIDYAFVYRSQALQHHLPFLRLPPEINLGDPNYADLYRRVSIELPGAQPGSTVRKTGDAIVFAVTIPKVARQPDLAARYVAFLLSPAGRSLLTDSYVMVVDQPWTSDPGSLPELLRKTVAPSAPAPGSAPTSRTAHGR
jgi:molybdate/tungstate transport system substrate-binding protein